jgi:hypothetical protein
LDCAPSSERILKTNSANATTDPCSNTICANNGMHTKHSIVRF